jgi:uncharacterized protein (DUF1684 family)
MIAEDLIFLHFRETTSTANDTCSHAVRYLVVKDVWSSIEHYNTISIVFNLVAYNPAEAYFN